MVARVIHPDTLAALSSGVHYPVVFVYLDWPDTDVARYMHSSVGTIAFNGQEWHGVGSFGRLSIPSEGGGLAQTIAEIQAVGYPQELETHLDRAIRGRRAEVWYGCLAERAGNELIGEPFLIYTGFMDAMRDTLEAEAGGILRLITLSVVDGPSQRLATMLHHTDEDQRRRFPDDTAGRLVLFSERRVRDLRWPE